MENNKEKEFIKEENIKNLASYILNLSPFEFSTTATILGYALSLILTTAEQNSVGNWFELVGQILLTFNAQGANQLPPSPQQFIDLEDKVNKIEKIINELNIIINKTNK